MKLQEYAAPREIAGRVSQFALIGDHLQLPPAPTAESLLAPINGASDEHKAGIAMFAGIENVFLMETMMRFTDPVPRGILKNMRTPGGARLADNEWKTLKATTNDQDTLRTEAARAEFNKRIEGCIHTCYLRGVVTLSAYTCAKQSARHARRTLFYVQAVDAPEAAWPFDARPTNPKAREMSTCMLQVPNLTTTKRLPGIVCVHENTPMRRKTPPTASGEYSSCIRPLCTPSSTASSSVSCRARLAPNT